MLGGRDAAMETLNRNIEAILEAEGIDKVEQIDKRLLELQEELIKRANSREDFNDLADEIDRCRKDF